MSTIAANPRVLSSPAVVLPGRRFDHIFFLVTALMMAATVYVGFAPTYYYYCVIKKEPHKKDNSRVAEAEPWQCFAEGWRWTKDYAAPRAPGEPRGWNWGGISTTGRST